MKAPTSGAQYGGTPAAGAGKQYGPANGTIGKSQYATPDSKRSRSNSPARKEADKKNGNRSGSQDSNGSMGTQSSSASNSRDDKRGSRSKSKKQESSDKGANLRRSSIAFQETLADAEPSQREGIVLDKMEVCGVVYNFRNDSDARAKEVKRQSLVALIEYLGTATAEAFSEAVSRAAVEMVSRNIFRTLEIREHTPLDMLDIEDEEPYLDPNWPHLSLVYELLRSILVNKEVDVKVMPKYFNRQFITRLVELLDSSDSRERELIKAIVQKYYSRFGNMKSPVRKILTQACVRAAFEEQTPNGLGELLELQSKVIHGFSAPLKEEAIELLVKVLIPLHKVSLFVFFHRQLVQCMSQFIDKDATLCYDVVRAVLLFWPLSCGSKQVLFLEELEHLLPLLPSADFVRLRDNICGRLIDCINCPNSLVAERALELWRCQPFLKLLSANRNFMFPQLISALYRNATEHWHGPVHGRTFDVLKICMEADGNLFEESSAAHRRSSEERWTKDEKRERRWKTLQDLFEKKRLTIAAAAAAKPKAKPKVSVKAKGKPKQNSRSSVMSKLPPHLANSVPLPGDSYGLSVSAATAKLLGGLDLQALVVDSGGDVVNAVTRENFTAIKAAVVHAPCTELAEPGSESVDSEGRTPFRPGHSIWVTLSRLPAHAKQLFFLLVESNGGPGRRDAYDGSQTPKDARSAKEKASFSSCTATLFDGASGRAVVSLQELPESSRGAVLLCLFERLEDGNWTFASIPPPASKTTSPKHPPAHDSAHFADAFDLIGPIVRETNSNAMKPQRVSLSLETGSVADNLQGLVPKHVFFGAGWDFSNPPSSNVEKQINVDISVAFFGAGGKELGAVHAEKLEKLGVRHSGNGLLSAGVAFTFEGIAKEVSQMFILMHMTSSNFEQLQNVTCRVIDHQGGNIVRYAVPECRRQSGLILGRICLQPGRRRWCFQSLGVFCGGKDWKDEATKQELRDLATKSLADFQYDLDDSQPAVLTSSGRLLASI